MASDKLLKSFLDLMEEKNWILRLKAGAERSHQVPLEVKDIRDQVKREREVKVGKGIFNGRPFLKEVLDVSQLAALRTEADFQAE